MNFISVWRWVGCFLETGLKQLSFCLHKYLIGQASHLHNFSHLESTPRLAIVLLYSLRNEQVRKKPWRNVVSYAVFPHFSSYSTLSLQKQNVISKKTLFLRFCLLYSQDREIEGAFHFAKATGQRSVGIPKENETVFSN